MQRSHCQSLSPALQADALPSEPPGMASFWVGSENGQLGCSALEARSSVPETQRRQHLWYPAVHFSKYLLNVSAVLGIAGDSGEVKRQVLALEEFTALLGSPT